MPPSPGREASAEPVVAQEHLANKNSPTSLTGRGTFESTSAQTSIDGMTRKGALISRLRRTTISNARSTHALEIEMARITEKLFAAAAIVLALSCGVSAETKSPTTLFQNVRIFNGRDLSVSAPSNVLVTGNLISRISSGAIAADASTMVIAGGSRILMPGLIDAHWHA